MAATSATAGGGAAASSSSSSSYRVETEQHPSQRLFQAVVDEDYDSLTKLFAINARNSIVSFMSMKSRWARQQDNLAKSGTFEPKIYTLTHLLMFRQKATHSFLCPSHNNTP
jgi:hypothetical protein